MIGNQQVVKLLNQTTTMLNSMLNKTKNQKRKAKVVKKICQMTILIRVSFQLLTQLSTTEPDGKGTMATAKAGYFLQTQRKRSLADMLKKSLRKAARFIEKAVQTMEATPALNKAALPKIGRAGSVTVQ
jgi:DNA gyrase/topoisomerase IV subunit B